MARNAVLLPGRDTAALALVVEPYALSEDLESLAEGRPVVLEIGFGRAEFILSQAEERPGAFFLGVEVSRKRVAKAAKRAARLELPNLRMVQSPAEYLVERVLPSGCIDECWVNFPDPWPKQRHFKRRVFQPEFSKQLVRVLRPGAVLHAATDHLGYAEWIHAVLDAVAELENQCAPQRWSSEAPVRITTAYESEWISQGRSIAYLCYRRR